MANLLEKHSDDPELIKSYANKIKGAGSYLLNLINEVLEMARIESGATSVNEKPTNLFDIASQIRAVFDEEYRNKKIVVTDEIYPDHPYVLCDMTKIQELEFPRILLALHQHVWVASPPFFVDFRLN